MKSKNGTYGAISVALGILILLLSLVFPTNTLAILGVASLIIPFLILKTDYKTAIFAYIATSIISFFFIPTNYSILYVIFFGNYSIIKALIEKIQKIVTEFIIKIIYFNFVLTMGYTLFMLLSLLNVKYIIPIFILTNIAFIIYDIALSKAIEQLSKYKVK